MKKRIKALLPSKRKWMQLYFALLFNANVSGFISGSIFKGNSKNMCVPGLNCYSCPGAIGACPLGSLQGAISSSHSTLFYVCGILALYGLFLGRMICGWLCPFGLIQELVYKIKTPKLKKNAVTRILSYLKYVILAFFVFLVPITYAFRDVPLPTFCKYICPAGTLEGGIGLLSNAVNDSYFSMLGPLFTWKFLLMVSFLVACVFVFRAFCRFICPLGALYGFFNRISFFGVKVNEPQCTHCNRCVAHCKMDIAHVGDHECIGCGECVSVCPTNAIVWKGVKPKAKSTDTLGSTVKGHKVARIITRSIAVVAMLGILGGAVAYSWTPAVKVGTAIGDKCYSAQLTIVDESGITEQTIDPSAQDAVTIINFWGTWCTPCVQELPYFDQIATDYADRVKVIAVHTDMIADTAPAFIEKYYAESSVTFAKDFVNEDAPSVEQYYTNLGGKDAYPYTVVLDADGVIQKIFVSSVHYEDLQAVVDELL